MAPRCTAEASSAAAGSGRLTTNHHCCFDWRLTAAIFKATARLALATAVLLHYAQSFDALSSYGGTEAM